MLESLEAQVLQMKAEAEAIASTPSGNSEEAMELRQMENRLNKAIIKCNEARHIYKTYNAILQKLDEVCFMTAVLAGCTLAHFATYFAFRKGSILTMRLLIFRGLSSCEARN